MYSRSHSGAVVLLGLFLFCTPASAKLLFKDDFSRSDLTKHNDYFRWGRSGKIPDRGFASDIVVTAKGPGGQRSGMLKFEYTPGDLWEEIRFHLTRSASEKRTETGASNTTYPDIWIAYSMRVPDNYYHPLKKDGRITTANNKGWVFLWKGDYHDDNQIVRNNLVWWPIKGANKGNSVVSLNPGPPNTHNEFTPKYVRNQEQVPGSQKAWAITNSERGEWIDYVFHFRLASGPNKHDGIVEIYKNGTRAVLWSTNSWPRDGNPAHAGFDRGYIMGYHNVTANERQIFYIDNFRLGTKPRDVGLDLENAGAPPDSPKILSIESD